MEYMFTPGFLGTRAPFFMDLVTLIVALLPLLLYLGILAAREGYYGVHRIYQWSLFLISFAVVSWFEYGVRVGGGFQSYALESRLPRWLLLGILIVHILIALLTTIGWVWTIVQAERHWRSRDLPGGYSLRHLRSARVAAWGIFLTALTGIWVYLALFVF
ncbi:DUF420 domain-containing protein [Nitratifractor sp.]